MVSRRCCWLLVVCCALLLPAGAAALAACEQATRPLAPGSGPMLRDDAGWEGLAAALDHSLASLERMPSARAFSLCGRPTTALQLRGMLAEFRALLEEAGDAGHLARLVAERFDLCQAAGRQGSGAMLVTGYYEPEVAGSLVRKPPYLYPLYRVPPDLEVTADGRIGRRQNGRLIPYWTRAEIEERRLLAGEELVYLADPVDAFVIHIQGSGRIRLPDGTVRTVRFAAKNGRPYRSIGRLLVEEGKIPLAEVTLPRLRAYLRQHPDEQQRIFHYNESYIFFRWGEENSGFPPGSLGEPLTPGRSVALDQRCFPPAAIGFLTSWQPVFDPGGTVSGWRPLNRFVFNQDSGSAIRGPGRIDLFWGSGPAAEEAAGVMKHPGVLYFLIPKD